MVQFVLNREPEVAYRKGDVLVSGGQAAFGKWEYSRILSSSSEVTEALSAIVKRLAGIAANQPVVLRDTQVSVLLSLPTCHNYGDVIIPADLLKSLSDISAVLYIRGGGLSEHDPHWQGE
jgi:hypothetical protein